MQTNQRGNILVIILAVAAIIAVIVGSFIAFRNFFGSSGSPDDSIPHNPVSQNKKPDNLEADATTTTEIATTAQTVPETPAKFVEYGIDENSLQTVNAANQFAFELYREYKDAGKNVFFSPYSISSALEMTYEGARGKTAEEMKSVFHFPYDKNIRIPSFANLYRQINPENASYQLSTANALWAQKDYPFDANYLKTIETYYNGKTTNLDFINDAEGSRITINNWVSSKTNSKIPEIIGSGQLNNNTRLILTNAIYFKGEWAAQFDKSQTRENDFTTATQATVKTSIMNSQDDFKYAQTADYQALELPYQKKDLSMFVVLPEAGKMNAFEKNLTIDEFNKIKNSLSTEEVDVYLPKFKFDADYNLNDTLKKMGMPTPFTYAADFSGMNGLTDLYIGLIIHKAFIDVNEEGTEAAAATAVHMWAESAVREVNPPKIFNADHPFIFAIVHNQSGSILFLGKVNDPTK